MKIKSNLKAVRITFDLLGSESNIFPWALSAAHSNRQDLDKVVVKVIPGEGPKP